MQLLASIIFTVFVQGALVPTQLEAPVPIPGTCTYYTQVVEPLFQCGPKGYVLGYGAKFCQAFSDDRVNFSPNGQAWIWSVMDCLQAKLVPVVEAQVAGSSITCAQLKTFGFGTHPTCYTLPSNSICKDLPPSDIIHILFTIRSVIFDIETLQQAITVVQSCGDQYAHIFLDMLAGKKI
jgi:hypothetical protein